MKIDLAAFGAVLASGLLLTGCATSAPSREAQSTPLPPAPQSSEPGTLAPMTNAVKALAGEWRPVSGPKVSSSDVLTIWSPMFSWGSGCNSSQGMLRDEGDGRFTVEEGFGGTPEDCGTLEPLAPFTGA